MNQKFVKRNSAIINISAANELAGKLGLNKKLVELLFCRALDSEATILDFLQPGISQLHDPFLLKGMREAVDRINAAIDGGERVLVFGDYDADGICATAILSMYLKSRGIEVAAHIPCRHTEGYGLNTEVLERLIEEHNPDLILTCDCGITGVDEVSYILDLGLDVIVTDHHEPKDCLPECICINHKQVGCTYPEKNLAGVGVAFKLIEAVGGTDAAMQYIDLCALATIADMVPLVGENRALVTLGLLSESRRSLGFSALLKFLKLENPTSTDVAFKIAPRINAAGRMGDARLAFELLTSTDNERINELIAKLEGYNNARKDAFATMLVEAKEDLKFENLSECRAIVLSNPSWQKGVTGIMAAQLSAEFNRPVFIIAAGKGTARGIDGVSVYELLGECSDLLVDFGGHSQAAGFTIVENQIDAFKQRVNSILQGYPLDIFLPRFEYDIELNESDCTLDFIESLQRLEPVGTGNARPIFLVETNKLAATPLKNNHRHINITLEDGLAVIAFNSFTLMPLLNSSAKKQLLLELNIDKYGGKKKPNAILRALDAPLLFINPLQAAANFIKSIAVKSPYKPQFSVYDEGDLTGLLSGKLYGTLIVAGGKKSYAAFIEKFGDKIFAQDYMQHFEPNNYSRIIVSPNFDASLELGYYDKIIFLDYPAGKDFIALLNKRTKAKIYLPFIDNSDVFFSGLDLSRKNLGRYYGAIKDYAAVEGYNVWDYFNGLKARETSLCIRTFAVALAVFLELKLVKVLQEPFRIQPLDGAKNDLSASAVLEKALIKLGGNS